MNITLTSPLITINSKINTNQLYFRKFNFTDIYTFTTSIPSNVTVTPNTFTIINDPITTNSRNVLFYTYDGSSITEEVATFPITVTQGNQDVFVEFYFYTWDLKDSYVQLILDDVVYLQGGGIDVDPWAGNGNSFYINLQLNPNKSDDYYANKWNKYIFKNLSVGSHTIKVKLINNWSGCKDNKIGVARIGTVNELINSSITTEITPQVIIDNANITPAKSVTSLLVKQDLSKLVSKINLRTGNWYNMGLVVTSNIKPSTQTIVLNAIPATGARQVVNAITESPLIDSLKLNLVNPTFFTDVHLSLDSTNIIRADVKNPRFLLNYLFYLQDISEITPSSCRVSLILDRIGEFDLEELGVVYTYKNALTTESKVCPITMYDTIVGCYDVFIKGLESDRDYIFTAYVKLKNNTTIYFDESTEKTIRTLKRTGISLCLSNITNNSMCFNISDIPTGVFPSDKFPLKLNVMIKNINNQSCNYQYSINSQYNSSLFESSQCINLPPNTPSDTDIGIYCDVRGNDEDILSIWKYYTTFKIPPIPITTIPNPYINYCYENFVQIKWDNVPEATQYQVRIVSYNSTEYKLITLNKGVTSFEYSDAPIDCWTKFEVRALNSKYCSNYSSILTYTPKPLYPAPIITINNGMVSWNYIGTNYYEIFLELKNKKYNNIIQQSTVFSLSQYVDLVSVKVRGVGVDSNGHYNRYGLFSQPIIF